jgi:predicted nucleic acid-binding protein
MNWWRAGSINEFDLADACLIRLADEFGTGDILTLDRDFAIYRWGKNKLFRMLPSLS